MQNPPQTTERDKEVLAKAKEEAAELRNKITNFKLLIAEKQAYERGLQEGREQSVSPEKRDESSSVHLGASDTSSSGTSSDTDTTDREDARYHNNKPAVTHAQASPQADMVRRTNSIASINSPNRDKSSSRTSSHSSSSATTTTRSKDSGPVAIVSPPQVVDTRKRSPSGSTTHSHNTSRSNASHSSHPLHHSLDSSTTDTTTSHSDRKPTSSSGSSRQKQKASFQKRGSPATSPDRRGRLTSKDHYDPTEAQRALAAVLSNPAVVEAMTQQQGRGQAFPADHAMAHLHSSMQQGYGPQGSPGTVPPYAVGNTFNYHYQSPDDKKQRRRRDYSSSSDSSSSSESDFSMVSDGSSGSSTQSTDKDRDDVLLDMVVAQQQQINLLSRAFLHNGSISPTSQPRSPVGHQQQPYVVNSPPRHPLPPQQGGSPTRTTTTNTCTVHHVSPAQDRRQPSVMVQQRGGQQQHHGEAVPTVYSNNGNSSIHHHPPSAPAVRVQTHHARQPLPTLNYDYSGGIPDTGYSSVGQQQEYRTPPYSPRSDSPHASTAYHTAPPMPQHMHLPSPEACPSGTNAYTTIDIQPGGGVGGGGPDPQYSPVRRTHNQTTTTTTTRTHSPPNHISGDRSSPAQTIVYVNLPNQNSPEKQSRHARQRSSDKRGRSRRRHRDKHHHHYHSPSSRSKSRSRSRSDQSRSRSRSRTPQRYPLAPMTPQPTLPPSPAGPHTAYHMHTSPITHQYVGEVHDSNLSNGYYQQDHNAIPGQLQQQVQQHVHTTTTGYGVDSQQQHLQHVQQLHGSPNAGVSPYPINPNVNMHQTDPHIDGSIINATQQPPIVYTYDDGNAQTTINIQTSNGVVPPANTPHATSPLPPPPQPTGAPYIAHQQPPMMMVSAGIPSPSVPLQSQPLQQHPTQMIFTETHQSGFRHHKPHHHQQGPPSTTASSASIESGASTPTKAYSAAAFGVLAKKLHGPNPTRTNHASSTTTLTTRSSSLAESWSLDRAGKRSDWSDPHTHKKHKKHHSGSHSRDTSKTSNFRRYQSSSSCTTSAPGTAGGGKRRGGGSHDSSCSTSSSCSSYSYGQNTRHGHGSNSSRSRLVHGTVKQSNKIGSTGADRHSQNTKSVIQHHSGHTNHTNHTNTAAKPRKKSLKGRTTPDRGRPAFRSLARTHAGGGDGQESVSSHVNSEHVTQTKVTEFKMTSKSDDEKMDHQEYHRLQKVLQTEQGTRQQLQKNNEQLMQQNYTLQTALDKAKEMLYEQVQESVGVLRDTECQATEMLARTASNYKQKAVQRVGRANAQAKAATEAAIVAEHTLQQETSKRKLLEEQHWLDKVGLTSHHRNPPPPSSITMPQHHTQPPLSTPSYSTPKPAYIPPSGLPSSSIIHTKPTYTAMDLEPPVIGHHKPVSNWKAVTTENSSSSSSSMTDGNIEAVPGTVEAFSAGATFQSQAQPPLSTTTGGGTALGGGAYNMYTSSAAAPPPSAAAPTTSYAEHLINKYGKSSQQHNIDSPRFGSQLRQHSPPPPAAGVPILSTPVWEDDPMMMNTPRMGVGPQRPHTPRVKVTVDHDANVTKHKSTNGMISLLDIQPHMYCPGGGGSPRSRHHTPVRQPPRSTSTEQYHHITSHQLRRDCTPQSFGLEDDESLALSLSSSQGDTLRMDSPAYPVRWPEKDKGIPTWKQPRTLGTPKHFYELEGQQQSKELHKRIGRELEAKKRQIEEEKERWESVLRVKAPAYFQS